MSKLYNMETVYPLIETLYGIEADTDRFEDIALAGWELIGNKHTRLYRYTDSTTDGELELPCNVDVIESVSIPRVDAAITSNKTDYIDLENIRIEAYIEGWKHDQDAFAPVGKYVKYKEGDNKLYFNRDYHNVVVVYHGIIVDENSGLPLINDKEMKAIACYIAWRELWKEGLRKRNKDSFAIAQELQAEWLRKCNAAKVSDHLTQNDMDRILDVRYRWDRKIYGKSYAPII